MVRIEVAVSPRPCLGCAVELVLRVAPLHRGVPHRQCVVNAVEEHIRLCILGCHHHLLPQQLELHFLSYYTAGDEVPLGRFVRARLRQLAQKLLKSGPEFP